MNNRYLELSSSYRNRFEYPNPSKFTVLLNESGNMVTAKQSFNPISTSMPCYNFQVLVIKTENYLVLVLGV